MKNNKFYINTVAGLSLAGTSGRAMAVGKEM